MASTDRCILVVLGTRPEVIKLAPVVAAARRHADWQVVVCSSGQHADLLEPALAALGLVPDASSPGVRPGQGLNAALAACMIGVDAWIERYAPAWVVVQGDTTTALAATLAAFQRKIAVAHVEAGLRTHDLCAPFPEEANRRLIGTLATLHLAPTPSARAALLHEHVSPRDIVVTGNTVVDTLHMLQEQSAVYELPTLPTLTADSRFVLITGHRRESFDGGLERVCMAVARLASNHPSVRFVYPMHPNPNVRGVVEHRLAGFDNVELMPAVDYVTSLWLVKHALVVVTDSGGLQEEAPSFGTPVVVTRARTERHEGVAAGLAVLVGHDADAIVEHVERHIASPKRVAAGLHANPYGDGRAAERCVCAIRQRLQLPCESPLKEWA